MVAVKQGTFQSLEETGNAAHGNIMTIRIKYRTEMLRLVIVHAPQETDDVEERTEFYEEVAVQVQGAENVDDRLVVVGDFNARIDENSISEPNSPNGRLLQELIAENQLQVVSYIICSILLFIVEEEKSLVMEKASFLVGSHIHHNFLFFTY